MAFELPTHCAGCGVYLMGGATRHTRDCPIRADIAEMFPDYPLPDPEDTEAGDEPREA